MSNIPQDISDYIDIAIERERQIFKKDVEHINGALLEGFRHEIRLVCEYVDMKPGREEVREMIHEEVGPLARKMDIVIEEVSEIRKSLDAHVLAHP